MKTSNAVGPDKKFVLLTTQRSGSTWVMDVLNQCPQTEGHGELFLPQPRLKPPIAERADFPRFIEQRRDGVVTGPRPLVTWRYLNSLYARPGCIGFKLMYSQLAVQPEILAFLVWRRISIVHLVRQNVFEIFLSEQRAKTTGTSHRRSDEAEDSPTPMIIDPDLMRRRVTRVEHNLRKARLLLALVPCPQLEVSYESLLSDEAGFLQITAFLDTERPSAPSRLAKRGTKSYEATVGNFDEVARQLRAMGRAHYLTSGT